MDPRILGVVFSLISSVTRGGSIVCLKPINRISPFVTQLISALISAVISLVCILVIGYGKSVYDMFDISKFTIYNILFNFGFSIFGTIANILTIYAVQISGSATIMGAISSSYVLFILFSFTFFNEYIDIKLQYAIPGIIFTCLGVVLLSLSQK